jgi:UDP-glucose 4-epimerase
MSSRGSVIPLFKRLLRDGKPLTVTHPEMTRFMLTFMDASDLILFAMENMQGGELFVKKAPSASIVSLAETMIKMIGKGKGEIEFIGPFAGEKIHEILLSEEEMMRCQDLGDYFLVSPWTPQPNKNKIQSEYCSRDQIMGKDKIQDLLLRSESEMQAMNYSDGYFVM